MYEMGDTHVAVFEGVDPLYLGEGIPCSSEFLLEACSRDGGDRERRQEESRPHDVDEGVGAGDRMP
jgi:hypothetical protein